MKHTFTFNKAEVRDFYKVKDTTFNDQLLLCKPELHNYFNLPQHFSELRITVSTTPIKDAMIVVLTPSGYVKTLDGRGHWIMFQLTSYLLSKFEGEIPNSGGIMMSKPTIDIALYVSIEYDIVGITCTATIK